LRIAAAISALEKSDTMGERIGRIERIGTDFFLIFLLKIRAFRKKNPFQSARSAQSVLPLYRHFPNEKLLDCGFRIAESIDFQQVKTKSTIRNPQSEIRNPKSNVLYSLKFLRS
jgi:hypothetical protein